MLKMFMMVNFNCWESTLKYFLEHIAVIVKDVYLCQIIVIVMCRFKSTSFINNQVMNIVSMGEYISEVCSFFFVYSEIWIQLLHRLSMTSKHIMLKRCLNDNHWNVSGIHFGWLTLNTIQKISFVWSQIKQNWGMGHCTVTCIH